MSANFWHVERGISEPVDRTSGYVKKKISSAGELLAAAVIFHSQHSCCFSTQHLQLYTSSAGAPGSYPHPISGSYAGAPGLVPLPSFRVLCWCARVHTPTLFQGFVLLCLGSYAHPLSGSCAAVPRLVPAPSFRV